MQQYLVEKRISRYERLFGLSSIDRRIIPTCRKNWFHKRILSFFPFSRSKAKERNESRRRLKKKKKPRRQNRRGVNTAKSQDTSTSFSELQNINKFHRSFLKIKPTSKKTKTAKWMKWKGVELIELAKARSSTPLIHGARFLPHRRRED